MEVAEGVGCWSKRVRRKSYGFVERKKKTSFSLRTSRAPIVHWANGLDQGV